MWIAGLFLLYGFRQLGYGPGPSVGERIAADVQTVSCATQRAHAVFAMDRCKLGNQRACDSAGQLINDYAGAGCDAVQLEWDMATSVKSEHGEASK